MDSTSEIGALIIGAAASGDLKKLKEIRTRVGNDREFRRICDVYSDFSTGWSVLHHAAGIGHTQICKFLIENIKVYIDASSYNRDTPLVEATKENHVRVVEYLLDQGAAVNVANLKGYTALHYAVLKDNRELMKLLVLYGAGLDDNSVDGNPLQIAASHGNVKALKFLLSSGAKPNTSFIVLESPLVCAIMSHSFQCLEALLKGKADPNKYFAGKSPLSYAAKESDTRYLKALLEAGAEANSPLGNVQVIEDAALANNREGVEILFPLTRRIKHYPKWTVDGIIEYCHSEEAKEQREDDKRLTLAALEKAGEVILERNQYKRAIVYLIMANHLDPSNPKWASKRSLCHAHEHKRELAIYSAEECFRLEPRSPAPHPGDTKAAAEIIKKFSMASLAFMLDPYDNKTADAFRVALFDYFALLYLMSSPEEILRFSQESSS